MVSQFLCKAKRFGVSNLVHLLLVRSLRRRWGRLLVIIHVDYVHTRQIVAKSNKIDGVIEVVASRAQLVTLARLGRLCR